MEKRTKLAILVLIGLLLILLGLYFFFSPYLAERAAKQPPKVNQGTPLIQGGQQPYQATTTGLTPKATANPLASIEYRAGAIVERIGSGSSETAFLGYQDATSDMTPSGQATLRSAQAAMVKAHPASGTPYSMTTRVVASHATQGASGDAEIEVTVQAIQSVREGISGTATNSGKKIIVTFLKQSNGSYLVDSLVWSDIEL
jgi:hypothetical protein